MVRELPKRADLVIQENDGGSVTCLLQLSHGRRGNLSDHDIRIRAWENLVAGIIDRVIMTVDRREHKSIVQKLIADLMEG